MSYFNELIRILSTEKKLYVKLTELAEEKQQIIIQNDVSGLTDCLNKEEALIEEIEEVEKKRRQAVIGLCTKLDIPEKDLSFTKLRQFMDSEVKEKLDQFKSSLLTTLDKLHQINETNRVLIEEAMRLNDFSIQLLTEAATPKPSTYSKSGVDKSKSNHLIDKRA